MHKGYISTRKKNIRELFQNEGQGVLGNIRIVSQERLGNDDRHVLSIVKGEATIFIVANGNRRCAFRTL